MSSISGVVLELSGLHLGVLIVLSILFFFLTPSILKFLWEKYVVFMVPRDEFPTLPLPPGSLGYPLVGETISFLIKRCGFYDEKVKRYGTIYKTHLLFKPTIRVMGAKNVKKILLGENILVASEWPTSTRILLGAGSISQSSGIEHRVRRRNLMHAISYETLNDMVPALREVVHATLLDWCARGDVYAYPECKWMAFTLAARALLGLDMKSSRQSGLHKIFLDFLNNLMTVPFDLPGFGFRKGMRAKQKLIHMLEDLVPNTEKRHVTPIMRAVQESCDQLQSSSKYELYEGILDLLFAGHETVASSITNCIMFLGLNKPVVDKLRLELKEHSGSFNADQGNAFNLKSVNELKYLDRVMKEVLRLCPPAGAGFRKVLKSFELGGYLIPKGWTVMYSIRETQHLSPIFHRSERFDPDRWETLEKQEGCSNAARFHYIPFGLGMRGCVGKGYAQLLIKIFLIELVQTCDWQLKNENIVMEYIPIPKAQDDLPVRFREHNICVD